MRSNICFCFAVASAAIAAPTLSQTNGGTLVSRGFGQEAEAGLEAAGRLLTSPEAEDALEHELANLEQDQLSLAIEQLHFPGVVEDEIPSDYESDGYDYEYYYENPHLLHQPPAQMSEAWKKLADNDIYLLQKYAGRESIPGIVYLSSATRQEIASALAEAKALQQYDATLGRSF